MSTEKDWPSNTAVPRYYSQFRDMVMRGEIPVSEQISMEMNRIDGRIRSKDIYFSQQPVEAFIAFCEGEMTKTDGGEIRMLFTFKLWAEQLFGWYYYATETVYENGEFVERQVLKRLIKKLYLIVARGAAKTMFEAFVQAYFLFVDGETTHQVTTAPTMKQAEEVLSPIRTAITRARGPLLNFFSMQLPSLKKNYTHKTLVAPTKKGIENFLTNSLLEIRPMSINKLQGLRTKIASVDEWLSGDLKEDPIGAIEQGASKLSDYIILAVSSEGTVRNGPGDDIKLELLNILKGEYEDPHTCIFYYRLDSVEEVGDPALWVKAQPNLGITVSWEAYYRDVLRAENAPSARNDILAKRFGLPMEGYTYFFTYEETLPHPRRSANPYRNMVCAMGADLSQGDDFCSFAFLFPLRGEMFGLRTLSFITERTLRRLPISARNKYDEFIEEESLIILPGNILDMAEVYEHVERFYLEKEYHIIPFGYDPYNAETFVRLYKETNGMNDKYNKVEPVRQGVRTESVPLGEIKTMMEDRSIVFDQRIVNYAMGNTMVLEDNNGNRKLYKRRYEHKIDPVSALLCAYVAYTRHADSF
jgi:phage terminase large subunit-like protein